MSNPIRTFNGEEYVPLEFYQEEHQRWIELRKADTEKLYHHLAAEAVDVMPLDMDAKESWFKALPLSKLKAIMEIKES